MANNDPNNCNPDQHSFALWNYSSFIKYAMYWLLKKLFLCTNFFFFVTYVIARDLLQALYRSIYSLYFRIIRGRQSSLLFYSFAKSLTEIFSHLQLLLEKTHIIQILPRWWSSPKNKQTFLWHFVFIILYKNYQHYGFVVNNGTVKWCF